MADTVLVEEAITEPGGAAAGIKRPVLIETEDDEGNPFWQVIHYLNPPSNKAFLAEAGRRDFAVPATEPEKDAAKAAAGPEVDESIQTNGGENYYTDYETGGADWKTHTGTYIIK
jgi:hypothetical protein